MISSFYAKNIQDSQTPLLPSGFLWRLVWPLNGPLSDCDVSSQPLPKLRPLWRGQASICWPSGGLLDWWQVAAAMTEAKFLRGHQVRSLWYFWLLFPHKLFDLTTKATVGKFFAIQRRNRRVRGQQEVSNGQSQKLVRVDGSPLEEKSPLWHEK